MSQWLKFDWGDRRYNLAVPNDLDPDNLRISLNGRTYRLEPDDPAPETQGAPRH